MFDGLMVTITSFKLIDRSGTDPQINYFYFICFLVLSSVIIYLLLCITNM